MTSHWFRNLATNILLCFWNWSCRAGSKSTQITTLLNLIFQISHWPAWIRPRPVGYNFLNFRITSQTLMARLYYLLKGKTFTSWSLQCDDWHNALHIYSLLIYKVKVLQKYVFIHLQCKIVNGTCSLFCAEYGGGQKELLSTYTKPTEKKMWSTPKIKTEFQRIPKKKWLKTYTVNYDGSTRTLFKECLESRQF